MSHTTLQRHPKCSALYANYLFRDSMDLRLAKTLAPSVAYLATVTVEVSTKTLTKEAPIFAVTVHDTKSSSTWRHLRSYTECRAFQNRVLRMLSRGHLCFAECPWLYAYVQRALPAERRLHYLFPVASLGSKPHFEEIQRQALVKLFATLQRVLLSPLDQKCNVLVQQVAPAVIKFITNQTNVNIQDPRSSPTYGRPLAKPFSETFMLATEEDGIADETFGQTNTSNTSSVEDLNKEFYLEGNALNAAVNNVVAGQRVCCAMCALHNAHSDEQIFAYWRAETMMSHFVRVRAGAGAEWTSIVAKRLLPTQCQTQRKDGWESSASSQRVTPPLELSVIPGDRDLSNHVLVRIEHDGTPKEPFPESASTPRTRLESMVPSSRASSVCEVDFEMSDDWRLSSAVPSSMLDCDTAPAANTPRCSGIDNIRWMPRHSLLMLSAI